MVAKIPLEVIFLIAGVLTLPFVLGLLITQVGCWTLVGPLVLDDELHTWCPGPHTFGELLCGASLTFFGRVVWILINSVIGVAALFCCFALVNLQQQ
jgi:hypothetical protein